MASQSHNKAMYPSYGAYQQRRSLTPHQAVGTHHHPRPVMPHVSSAFRPAGVPQVPLEQRFMPPVLMPYQETPHQQQQLVQHGTNPKHPMHPQHHLFQNPQPSLGAAGNYQRLQGSLGDVPQVAMSANKVGHPHPYQYQMQGLQQYGPAEAQDPETLHQQLRMMHALHYQEKMAKDPLDRYGPDRMRQEAAMNKSLQYQLEVAQKLHAHGRQTALPLIQDTLRNEQLLQQERLLKQKQVGREAQSQYPYDNWIHKQHEKVYHSRKRKIANRPEMQQQATGRQAGHAGYTPGTPGELNKYHTSPRLISPKVQHSSHLIHSSVPPTRGDFGGLMNMRSPMDEQHNSVAIAQQACSRTQHQNSYQLPLSEHVHGPLVKDRHVPIHQPEPVKHNSSTAFNSQEQVTQRRCMPTQPKIPNNSKAKFTVHQQPQQQQQLQQQQHHGRIHVSESELNQRVHGMQTSGKTDTPTYPKKVHSQTFDPVDSDSYLRFLQQAENIANEYMAKQREPHWKHTVAKHLYSEMFTSKRQHVKMPQSNVSIKEEQLVLRDEMSLQESHHKPTHGAVREAKKESPSIEKAPPVAKAPEAESMPKIVQVRSLAMPEQSIPVTVVESNGVKQCSPSVTVSPLGSKPLQPKALTIKPDQDLQEIHSGAHRVPSRSSVDNDGGRKDSWDSGIESPPWPEGYRDNGVMHVRNTTHARNGIDNQSLSSPRQDHRISLMQLEQVRLKKSNLLSSEHKVVQSRSASESLTKNGMDCPIDLRRSQSLQDGDKSTSQTKGTEMETFTKRSVKDRRCMSLDIVPDNHHDECHGVHNQKLQRKRSLPCEEVSPIKSKVPNNKPRLIPDFLSDNTQISQWEEEEANPIVTGHSVSDAPKPIDIENEQPLDLTVKKQESEPVSTSSDINKSLEEQEETVNPDSNTHGHFATVMMRALERLWATTKLNMDKKIESNKLKVSDSDDDSGKYFKPSSETTVDIASEEEEVENDEKKLEDKEDPEQTKKACMSIENAICELMQHSSQSFKHCHEIFDHFDGLIKQELLNEIKNHEPIAVREEEFLKENTAINNDFEGTHENVETSEYDSGQEKRNTIAFTSNYSIHDDYISEVAEADESQDLVIVESTLSPEALPDSQELKTVDSVESPNTQSESRKQTTETIDSFLNRLVPSPEIQPRNDAKTLSCFPHDENDCSNPGDVSADENDSFLIDLDSGLSPLPSSQLHEDCDSSNNKSDSPADLSKSVIFQGAEPHEMAAYHSNIDMPQNSKNEEFVMNAAEHSMPFYSIADEAHVSHVSCASKMPEDKFVTYSSCVTLKTAQTVTAAIVPSTSVGVQGSKPAASTAQTIVKSSNECPRKSAADNRDSVWQARVIDTHKVRFAKVAAPSINQVQPRVSLNGSATQDKQFTQLPQQQSPIILMQNMIGVPRPPHATTVPVIQNGSPSNYYIINTEALQRHQTPLKLVKGSPLVSAHSDVTTARGHQVLSVNLQPPGIAAPGNSNNQVSCNSGSSNSSDFMLGPFRMIKIPPKEPPNPKKPYVHAYKILYKNANLPGIVRSGVPFVPPRLLQEVMFPKSDFDVFCHVLQDCSIMQRYMTVLERAALQADLKTNKISSCKLVSLDEFHVKYDVISKLLKKENGCKDAK